MDIKTFITEYWNCVAAQKEEEIKEYFHKDACIRWHNTNEEFNIQEYLRANCDYPGSWMGEVKRIEQNESIVITVAHVWSNDMSFHVTSFFEIEEGKIKNLDEYWGEDGEAPDWRKEKKIGKPIHN